jgi:hypothetical protein
MGFRTWLFDRIRPITNFFGHLHMPFTHKKVEGSEYYTAYKVLKPGSVLLTRIDGEVSNFFIPGFFTHAAIYTPDPALEVDEWVTEATGK